ncbi:MAG: MFS transporter [bacterium]|nr:MFS transporter [bacterium]
MKPSSKNDPHSGPFQAGNVLLITFSHLLLDTYMSFIAPLLPLLIAKLGLSYFLAGLLTAGIRLPSLLNPLIGILADKLRLHYFIIFTPMLAGLVMSVLGAAPSYPLLLGLTLTGGLVSACYHVTSPVMMRSLAGQKTGRGMSFFMLGGDLAATVGPLVILGAVNLWGLEHTYWLILPGLCSTCFLYLRFKRIAVQQPVHTEAARPSLKETSKTLLPLFITLTGLYLSVAALEATLTSFLPTYLTAVKEVSLWIAGISLSLLRAGGIAGSMAAGPLSDRFGRKNVLLVIVVLLPLLMWMFLLSFGPATLPLLILLGVFLFGLRPVVLAIVHETNSSYPAYVNGIYMMINFVSNSAIILLMGTLSDKIGLENMYRVAATLSCGALFFTLKLPGDSSSV